MTKLETLTTKSPRWDEFAGKLSQSVLRVKNCRHDYQHAIGVMTAMGGVDIEASLAYCRDHGGYCDCEILFNVECDEEDSAA
jgi:hypothetical protein